MKVTITRETLLSHLKSMIRVVPKTNAVMELKGILVECDEDDGHIKLTATNIETTIQRRFKVNIDEGGSFVVAAAMFHNIMSLLSGEEVIIEQKKEGLISITSGSCKYKIPVLNARNYPRVPVPFPDDTIKVKGICSIYSKTAMAVASEETHFSMSGIHLDVYSDAVRAVACDMTRMAMTEIDCDCGGKLSVTIPTQPFYYLANAVNDSDELEMGICDNSIVFMKEGMVFATKYISEPYLDVSRLTEPAIRKNIAAVKAADLHRVIETVSTISSIGSGAVPVEVKITEKGLDFKIESVEATSKQFIPAEISDMAGSTFYYPPKALAEVMKVIKGDALLEMSANGMMYLSDAKSMYMLMSTKKRSVNKKKQSKKSTAKKAA